MPAPTTEELVRSSTRVHVDLYVNMCLCGSVKGKRSSRDENHMYVIPGYVVDALCVAAAAAAFAASTASTGTTSPAGYRTS